MNILNSIASLFKSTSTQFPYADPRFISQPASEQGKKAFDTSSETINKYVFSDGSIGELYSAGSVIEQASDRGKRIYEASNPKAAKMRNSDGSVTEISFGGGGGGSGITTITSTGGTLVITDNATSKNLEIKIDTNDKIISTSTSGILTNLSMSYNSSTGLLSLLGKSGQIINSVDIPLINYIDSAIMVVNPAGQPAGTYLSMTLKNEAGESKILYVNMDILKDIYTAGDNIAIDTNNIISATGLLKLVSIDTQIIDSDIAIGSGKELLAVNPINNTQHVLAAIKNYNGTLQAELANEFIHTNVNSLDRPTVETISGKEQVAYLSDINSLYLKIPFTITMSEGVMPDINWDFIPLLTNDEFNTIYNTIRENQKSLLLIGTNNDDLSSADARTYTAIRIKQDKDSIEVVNYDKTILFDFYYDNQYYYRLEYKSTNNSGTYVVTRKITDVTSTVTGSFVPLYKQEETTVDLNTLLDSGRYELQKYSNSPNEDGFFCTVDVFNPDGSGITQIWMDDNISQQFIRTSKVKDGSSWSRWQPILRVIDSEDMETTDLNDYQISGWYLINNDTHLNAPTNENYLFLQVQRNAEEVVIQNCWNNSNGIQYQRFLNGGEWSDWKQIATSSDLLSKPDKTITSTNGTSLLFNESDGGGNEFQNTHLGTTQFSGVNDGENGICAQMYAKNTVTNVGTRLNLTIDKLYYTKGKSASTDYGDEDEVATVGNINDTLGDIASILDTINGAIL